jgi:hypothetical protein
VVSVRVDLSHVAEHAEDGVQAGLLGDDLSGDHAADGL